MYFEIALIIGIIIVQILTISLAEWSRKTKINSEEKDGELYKFTKNIIFDHPTTSPQVGNVANAQDTSTAPSKVDTIVSNNKFDCNIHTLHVCLLNDVSTLFGCNELNVKCEHFNDDITAHENGHQITIPRNEHPNEGYALPITQRSDLCNPFHGDYVLVALDTTSTEYMLLCQCREPGYIGNESLLGSCNTVFMCDGKIDNINQPINKIQCICDPSQKNDRLIDGLPVCKSLSILEANEKFDDWSTVLNWNDLPTQSINIFNPTIRGNLKTSKLVDPCQRSILDYSIRVDTGQYDPVYKTCTVHDKGIPVYNESLDQNQMMVSEGGDNKIAYKTIDAVVHSGEFKSIRMIDRLAQTHRKLNIHVHLPWLNNDTVYLTLPTTIGLRSTVWDDASGGQLSMTAKKNIISGKCETTGITTYACYFEPNYNTTIAGIPWSQSNKPPDRFLWGTEFWNDVNNIGIEGVLMTQTGLSFNNDVLQKRDAFQIYGFQLCGVYEPSNCLNGFIRFKNPKDYTLHKQISI